MDSIKWKCKNWRVFFKKSDNFYLIHLIVKIGRVQLSFSFFLLSSLISYSRATFEHVFLNTCIKSGNITEKKNMTLKDF